MLEKNMRKNKEDNLEWLVNIDFLFANFQEFSYFDERLFYDRPTVYHLVGENLQIYKMYQYMKVFPKIEKQNMGQLRLGSPLGIMQRAKGALGPLRPALGNYWTFKKFQIS